MTNFNVTASSSRKCPLLGLSNELLHMIGTYLTPTEAANFRLLSKRIAGVAVEYIVPEIYLMVSKSSFKRLEAIVGHPVIKRHVTSLLFVPGTLPKLSRSSWEEEIQRRVADDRRCEMFRNTGEPWAIPEHNDYSNSRHRWGGLPFHEYDGHDLDTAYGKYQKYFEDQHQLLHCNAYVQRVIQALKQLPRLTRITVSVEVLRGNRYMNNEKEWAAFGPGLCVRGREIYGMDQTFGRSLLNDAYRAGLRLENFVGSGLGREFLQGDTQDFNDTKKGMTHLKKLHLNISFYQLDAQEKERLRQFIAAAPNLQQIGLGADRASSEYRWEFSPVELRDFAGSFHWKFLVHINIRDVKVSKSYLTGFLDRHSGTLRSVWLADMGLVDGNWASIFEMMRSTLNLGDVRLNGSFTAPYDPSYPAHINSTASFALGRLGSGKCTRLIHGYILGAGWNQSIKAHILEHGPKGDRLVQVLLSFLEHPRSAQNVSTATQTV